MNGADIISNFELYVDDLTELSSSEELTLANKVYKKICKARPWEFLRKTATGTLSTSVPYIALPSDYSIPTNDKVVYVIKNGSYVAYKIINYADKRDYVNQDGYAYIDLQNSRLVFTLQPTSAYSYEFDYIYTPDDLTTATEPVFPEDYHPMIYHGMAVQDNIIQMFDKARSYFKENQDAYNSYMSDLNYYNSQFVEI